MPFCSDLDQSLKILQPKYVTFVAHDIHKNGNTSFASFAGFVYFNFEYLA